MYSKLMFRVKVLHMQNFFLKLKEIPKNLINSPFKEKKIKSTVVVFIQYLFRLIIYLEDCLSARQEVSFFPQLFSELETVRKPKRYSA